MNTFEVPKPIAARIQRGFSGTRRRAATVAMTKNMLLGDRRDTDHVLDAIRKVQRQYSQNDGCRSVEEPWTGLP